MTDARSPENFWVREHERKEPLSSLTDVSKLPFETQRLNSTPVTLFWRSASPNSTCHVQKHPILIKHNRPATNEAIHLARIIPRSLQLLPRTKSTDPHPFLLQSCSTTHKHCGNYALSEVSRTTNEIRFRNLSLPAKIPIFSR